MSTADSGSTATGEDLGLVLRLVRQKLGWTQEDLARKTGISKEQIRRIEALKVPAPSLLTWRRLRRSLGLHGPAIQAVGPRLRRLEAEKWWIVDLVLDEGRRSVAELKEDLQQGMP
jgi:transcriptional regulator with XRE-family HTH domain